jgi:hypothetical protein
MRDLSKHLIMQEIHKTSDRGVPAAFRATDKLRPHLATMMGDGGFRALLSRAIVLSDAEAPWLRSARLQPDGALEGLEELQAQMDKEQFLEGNIVLLAQLLGLLEAFLGPKLTFGLVGEVWPNAPPKELVINNVNKNVRTK